MLIILKSFYYKFRINCFCFKVNIFFFCYVVLFKFEMMIFSYFSIFYFVIFFCCFLEVCYFLFKDIKVVDLEGMEGWNKLVGLEEGGKYD